MFTHKSIAMLSMLVLSLFANVADARSSRQAVGRVTQAQGSSVEFRLFREAPRVGAVYDLRRRRVHAPKHALPVRLVDVGQVRITEVVGDGLARAEVIKGAAKRRDRVFGSADAH